MTIRKKSIDIRYVLSREKGTIFKDWGGRLPVALIYPNSYYIGMSNLGIHVIYGLLNSYPDIVCERIFYSGNKTGQRASILSLESGRPLADFAVLAFSITYELDYFNIARILKNSGIPLYSADRDHSHPLVIAGGPCITTNPMPLAPFFDCLCIGEAEPILPAMLPVIAGGIGGTRDTLLQELAKLPGVYVPRHSNGKKVNRQWLMSLEEFPAHSIIMTPDTELGNLYLIEVERGCNWGCRFCLVSNAFSPMRFRSVDELTIQAKAGLQHKKRLGLVGPTVADHPQFDELLSSLRQMGAQISVSSLRIKPFPTIALKEIARGSTRTIALAPEAGSERLRQLIRKGISEDDILEAIHRVAKYSIKQLKLYFMIGLPSETNDDIEAIIDLTRQSKAILDRHQTGCRLTLTVAPFVPKAGTPFQWLPMERLPVLNERLSLLKNRLQPQGIKVKNESLAWSQVQGIMARGDTELAGVLANIDDISLSGWRQAMKKSQLDTDHYVYRRWDLTEKLPWSILDSGTDIKSLKTEHDRALSRL